MKRPNWRLYVSLSVVFFIITSVALLIDNTTNCFTVLSGIGCGGISSVIVALLVDLANCKEQNIKQKKLATFALNNIRVSLCYYLETIADLCIDHDSKLASQKHTFEEWVKIYVSKLKKGATVRRPWLLDAIGRAETAFRTFESNIYWLIDGEVISVEDYKKIRMLHKVIRGSKIHYLLNDKEPNPDIIMEQNWQIAAQIKLIGGISNLLKIPYSGNGDLRCREDAANEMEYLQQKSIKKRIKRGTRKSH